MRQESTNLNGSFVGQNATASKMRMRDERLPTHDGRSGKHDERIREQDERIREQDERIHELAQQIHALDKRIYARAKQIRQIETSFSWRVTAPIRTATGLIRRISDRHSEGRF